MAIIKTDEKWVMSILIAANEAINTFEGPKNGIILIPKDVAKSITASSIVSIFDFSRLFLKRSYTLFISRCVTTIIISHKSHYSYGVKMLIP